MNNRPLIFYMVEALKICCTFLGHDRRSHALHCPMGAANVLLVKIDSQVFEYVKS
jgi:CBS-domain-containing membrane protein